MATVILNPADIGCNGQDGRQPVAFGRWQRIESPRTSTFGAWELLCEPCVRDHINEPGYQLIFLVHHDPADHPGHVHVRYAGNISADHPTDI